ncbi:LamG-like jellyroll fold domain-containing protein [Actinoplanes missouriensis]|uniref:LamG-like jellyroll fold domain-containing protein n=1 Tax=Actinoplanes missouriensis TaxID=1866 RepID=UPI0033F0420E
MAGVVTSAVVLTHAAVPASAAPAEAVLPAAVAPAAASATAASKPLAIYDVMYYTESPTLLNLIEGGADATLRNGAALVVDEPFPTGNTNSGISLDGTDDYIDTPIALDTTRGFTVSAWAKLDRVDRAATVVSQSGSRLSNFRIGLDAAGKWQFTMPRADTDTAASDTVTGPAATVSVWTHLTGVYDASAAKMTLYVNGVAAPAVTHSSPWAASNGGVQWGRGLAAGAPSGYTDGSVTRFHLFQDALDARRAGELVINPELERADRCEIGHYLHAGGPAVKALAGRALSGTAYQRREVAFSADYQASQLDRTVNTDATTYRNAFYAQGARYDAWELVLDPYTIWGDEFMTFHQAPKYGEAMHRFLMQRTDDAYFRLPVPAKPAQAELDRALAIAAQMRAVDSWSAPSDYQVKGWSANRIARFLRFGGYPTVAPAEGTLEYRTEVESVKLLWAACESDDPDGARTPDILYLKDGALTSVVESARKEWAAELAAVAGQRNTIVAAEAQAQEDLRAASAALVEAQGQAWVVGQLFKWKKYWLSRPKTESGYPTTAQWSKAQTDITTATNAISAQLTVAKNKVTSAQSQVTKATTALTQAGTIAKANATPLYRGLEYAQQSAQVIKASAASALSAQKAIETTLNAAKATNADGAALQSLALTQQSALQAEYRRVAAEEAAAQAKAAAQAAAALATVAATEAARAKADRATAEAAETTAKKTAAEAHAKRLVAEAERDKATAARQTATAERDKAAAAKARAEQEQSTAAAARARTESAANTAAAGADRAEAAEDDAEYYRNLAFEAEEKRDETAARARSLEALAAAAEGTEAAQETRAAATEARAAASDAATAATNARAAANQAGTAAVASRAAATRSTAAAERSRAASDGAEAAAAKTRNVYLTAVSAAADALVAAENAAYAADQAEVEAKKAAAAAAEALVNAKASKAHADEATAESARTAGAAYAASESAFAARDSAAQAVTAAVDAITIGTPFAQVDASAGFAVLVGQSSMTIAQQQAATAQLRADEAGRAAKTAADLAAKAQANAKAAAQAAAAAAADAAAAAQSAVKARASAAAAAVDAKAAQAAADRCAEYDRQAQIDAVFANAAASTAESQARLADEEASDAERDADGARSAAGEAEYDSKVAQNAASAAEGSAEEAEASAANAQGYAQEAQDAAARAEEQARLDEIAAREAAMNAGPANVPGMTSEEEQYLFAACGQPCVDEYRAAVGMANLDVLDWVKQNGGQILLDVIGYTDAKECFTTGDIAACLWTAVNAAGLLVLVGKIPAVSAAIARVVSGIRGFFRGVDGAKTAITRFQEIIRIQKKADAVVVKPGKTPKLPRGVTMGVVRKHPRLADDGKYYLDDSHVDTKICPIIRKPDGKWSVGEEIVDIDRLQNGILWEEKTALGQMSQQAMEDWVQKQVVKKLGRYIIARPYIAGYEKAPIGLRFTEAGVSPALKRMVEEKIRYMRSLHPDADFRLEWAD